MGLGLCAFYAVQYSAGLTMTQGVGMIAWAIILGVLIWAIRGYSQEQAYMSFGRGMGLTLGICLIAGSLEGIFKAIYVSFFQSRNDYCYSEYCICTNGGKSRYA